MPKRNRTRKFVGGPQGDDAEMVMKISKIRELNADQKVVKDLQKKDDEEAANVASKKMIIDSVISWNWVDDDGNIIELPKDRTGIFDELTTEEAEYLGECFRNKTAIQVATEKK